MLSFLALQNSRPVARQRLGALLWPDAEPEVARRNLRQAIYNLRAVLGDGARFLLVEPQEIRLLASGVEVDVVQFEAAAHKGLEGRGPASVEALVGALEVYGGELLAGLGLRGADGFEEWHGQQKERLREVAMECAREALRRSEADGLHESALQFARRLSELDPLSEEACRAQMRLLSRLGRRAQALDHFGRFTVLLEQELEVEPGPDLQALQAVIAANQELPGADTDRPGPTGPILPLVGRERAWRELSEAWSEVRDGESRVTLVTGGRGTGKSRLVRTFVYRVLAGGLGTVLLARGRRADEGAFRALLAEAVASLPAEMGKRVSAELRAAVSMAVAALPEVHERRRDLPEPRGIEPFEPLRAVADLLRELTRRRRPARPGRGAPVVLFVDDLEGMPQAIDGLIGLRRAVGRAPVWILVVTRSDELGAESLEGLRSRVAADGGRGIELGTLGRDGVEHAAYSLVGEEGAGELGDCLFEASRGLPLALAEAVNLLADRGLLLQRRGGGCTLADPAALENALPVGPTRLIDQRLELLPNTSRRLLGLAAVIGERFDTSTLLEVDREHPAVLEAAMQILVERWMVRPLLTEWTAHRRDRDLAIWQAGGRRGPFEFAQRTVRDRLVDSIDPDRRRLLEEEIRRARARLDADGLAERWLAVP